jgi:hypothetical protein
MAGDVAAGVNQVESTSGWVFIVDNELRPVLGFLLDVLLNLFEVVVDHRGGSSPAPPFAAQWVSYCIFGTSSALKAPKTKVMGVVYLGERRN